jgi:hypothetical protein
MIVVGGRRGGVGMEETFVGVRGGDVGGVPYFTSFRDYAGRVSRQVAVAAGSCYKFFSSCNLLYSDFYGYNYFRGSWRSPMAQTGSFEGVYSIVASTQHLYLSCRTFGSLWPLVRAWIGFSTADAYSLSNHFVQFTHSAGGLWARRSFLQLVWLASVWVVWNERNHRVFRNSANSVH